MIDEKEYVLHAFLEAQGAHGFVTGKERVEDDDVGLGEDCFGNEFGAVGLDNMVAAGLENVREGANGGGVLVDDHDFLFGLALIEEGVDFVKQGCGVNGLGEIAIDAEAEAALLIFDDGEDDDGDVHGGGIVLENGSHIEAIHLRHHDVEDDETGDFFADAGESFAAVFSEAHGVALLGEFLLKERADVGIVVDDEDGLVLSLMRADALAQLADQGFDVDAGAGGKQLKLSGRLGDGQGEGKGAAVAGLAFDPDAAAVVFDDLLADGQAEAGALGLVSERVADLLEALEDFGLVGRCDADTGVTDADDQIAALGMSCEGDGAGIGEFDGVGDEIDDDLNEAVLIASDLRQGGLNVADELEFLCLEERCSGGNGALDDVLDGDLRQIPCELAGFDLGEVEDVVDELGEALAFADDDAKVFQDLGFGLRDLAVVFRDEREETVFETAADDFGKAEDGGERSAELVADGG